MNDPELNTAQSEYNTAANTASQYQTASQMLPAALKSAINEKIDYNKGLIEQKNKSMVDYFNAPSAARLQYQDIFNPFQREALVQKATNNAYLPYQNNADVLSARMGSIADIIANATGSFGAQVTSANNAATLAGNKIDLAKWKYDQTHTKPSSAAGQTSLEKLLEKQIMDMINGTGDTGGGFVPTAAQPNYSPNQGEGARDNSGQWIYHAGEWMINAKYAPASSTASTDINTINDDIAKKYGGQ